LDPTASPRRTVKTVPAGIVTVVGAGGAAGSAVVDFSAELLMLEAPLMAPPPELVDEELPDAG
jgi:hypothetical protein